MDAQVRPRFLLTKDWRDAEPGIELVEIRYACAPTGKPPEWSRDEQSRVLAPCGGEPLFYRRCAIELPCGLGAADAFTLHYYFLVVQNARQHTTPPIAEEIVAREVRYRDERGEYCGAAVQWSIGGTAAPNYSPLIAEPPRVAGTRAKAPAAGLPRLFRGRLWGPRGSTVYYVFHLHPEREAALGGASCDQRELWEADKDRHWQEVL